MNMWYDLNIYNICLVVSLTGPGAPEEALPRDPAVCK